MPAGAQYYPGGLGNSSLYLWLDANDLSTITQNGANKVSQWKDKSSPATIFNVGQATAANQPVYNASSLNARPAITFSSSGPQYLPLQASSGVPSSYFEGFSGFSDFFVYSAASNSTTTIFGKELVSKVQIGSTGGQLNFYNSSSGTGWTETINASSPIPVNTPALISSIYNANTGLNAYYQGSSLGSLSFSGQTLGSNANDFVVGSRPNGVEALTGNIGEILIYNSSLSNSQRIILQNYLSARWGITLTANAAYTPPSSSTFGTHLVGIGYTNAADNFLTNPVATGNGSTDGLGFSSGSGSSDFLNTAGYLMAAHNGQANTIIYNTTLPGINSSSTSLWNRSWYLEASGGNMTGQVTLNFNFSDYNSSSLPSAGYSYNLLYNATDGTFATGSNIVVATNSTTLSSNNVAFQVTASNLPNGYYTLMWTPIPLALGLTGFQALQEGETALLKWTGSWAGITQTEIQRKPANGQFTTIGAVFPPDTTTATGNGILTSSDFIDTHPLPGLNYYRLKLDNAGGFTYSNTCSLDFETPDAINLVVYPNPVSDRLEISCNNLSTPSLIRLIASDGRIISRIRTNGFTTLEIPVKGLPPGLYILEIVHNGNAYLKKIIKE